MYRAVPFSSFNTYCIPTQRLFASMHLLLCTCTCNLIPNLSQPMAVLSNTVICTFTIVNQRSFKIFVLNLCLLSKLLDYLHICTFNCTFQLKLCCKPETLVYFCLPAQLYNRPFSFTIPVPLWKALYL